MNLKKTIIATAVTATFGVPVVASADTINMTFTGLFTLIGGSGAVNPNSDAACPGAFGPFACDGFGSRTAVSGTGSFDTTTGAGSAVITPFSFFGNGAATATTTSFQHIGDGFGSTAGTLVAGQMGFNWNSPSAIPVTAIFDAAGFFDSIQDPGNTWTVTTGAVSATPNTGFGHAIGGAPMAMTSFDTAGTSLGSLFPLSDTGGIAGVPMTTAPFPGQNAAFDFTSITATNVSTGEVPVPAAAWLFGSGLLGLINIARRRKRNV